jgi:hypothetical protein
MKKKEQNTQSPHSSSLFAFLFTDFLYIFLCGICALASLGLFWRDLNLSLARLSEQPAGTITYKYRAAQRRFVDRVLWDRLKQESPVYGGDYIRTAELSQATIRLNAGDIIALEENTLIQLLPQRDGFRVNLAGGTISVDTPSGAVNIRAGETVVTAVPGGAVEAALGAGGLDLRVLEGGAEIRAGSERREATAGEAYVAAGGEISRGTARVAVLSPRPAAKLLNNGETPLALAFRWNRFGFAEKETVTLDIAEDRGFTRIVKTSTSGTDGTTAELANGVYYWRAYPSSESGADIRQGGVRGRLTVVYTPAPRLMRPRPDEVFRFSTTRPGIHFYWTACEGAAAYLVEAADNPAMTNAVYRSQVQAAGNETCSVVYSGLEPGTYYWRVTPVYNRDYEGTPVVSATASFRVEKASSLAAPEPMDREEIVYLEGEQGAIYFTWKQEDEAVSYTFLLSDQEDLSRSIIQETVRDNYYALDIKVASLNPGQYYWGVYQTDMEGNNSAISESRILVIRAGAPPERGPVPELPPAVAPPAAEVPVVQLPVEAPAIKPPAARPPVPAVVPREEAPRLPRPENLRPAAGYVLTEEIIVRDQRMDFSWNAVRGAGSYLLTIHQGEREIFRQTLRTPSYTLTDLSILDEGIFFWRVQAVPADPNTARPSENAESRFAVDLEEIQAAEGNQSGVMFGTD